MLCKQEVEIWRKCRNLSVRAVAVSIEFVSSVQKMKCPYCDTEFDVKTLSEYAQSVEEEEPGE